MGHHLFFQIHALKGVTTMAFYNFRFPRICCFNSQGKQGFGPLVFFYNFD